MVDWCAELEKLETQDRGCGCLPSGGLLPKPQSEPFIVKALKVMGAVLNQRLTQSRGSGNPRQKGVCRFYPKQCNLMNGGQICRRSTRLTVHCPFKDGFALKKDGTISTKLTDAAYIALLAHLPGMKR